MKRCFKRLVSAISIVFTLTALLSGCGSQDTVTKDAIVTQGKVAGETTKAEEVKKDVLIKFYTESDEATNTDRKYPEFIEAYQKNNPGVKIEMAPLVANFNYDEYAKKVNIMVAAGEQIDLIKSATLAEVSVKAKSGVLEPLDAYAVKEGVDLASEYGGITLIDNKVYAITEQLTSWLVFINKDMLDAAGLQVPARDWTWADYREYAKKMTKGEGANKVYGSYMHNWEWFFAIGIQSKIMDNPYFTADGKQNFSNAIFRDGMQYRYDLENVDKCQVPYVDIASQKLAYRSVFFSGKAAMTIMGAWMVSDIQLKDKYPHTFKTTFATFPRWDSTCKANTSAADGAGCGWSVNAKSSNKEETYKFIKALTSEGLEYGHKLWSAWKKSDAEATIKSIAGTDESLYDLAALKAVLFDTEKVENRYTYTGPGQTEVLDAYIQENETYLTGGQTLDKALENIIKA